LSTRWQASSLERLSTKTEDCISISGWKHLDKRNAGDGSQVSVAG
jgi:hypothetical protein